MKTIQIFDSFTRIKVKVYNKNDKYNMNWDKPLGEPAKVHICKEDEKVFTYDEIEAFFNKYHVNGTVKYTDGYSPDDMMCKEFLLHKLKHGDINERWGT